MTNRKVLTCVTCDAQVGITLGVIPGYTMGGAWIPETEFMDCPNGHRTLNPGTESYKPVRLTSIPASQVVIGDVVETMYLGPVRVVSIDLDQPAGCIRISGDGKWDNLTVRPEMMLNIWTRTDK